MSRHYPLLEKINSPSDLKKLEEDNLVQVCSELREFIIDSVSINPGHFGASLGVVELTVALHYVFNTPYDRLIWDVGHQAYAHKILTGRRQQFNTNRKYKGLSGFPKRAESIYDAFGVGHSSTSISAALGMPDVFVPLDTVGINRYFRIVSAKNLIYRYAFSVTDAKRATLQKFKTVKTLEAYLNTLGLLNGFEAYARKNNVVPKSGELKTSGNIIVTQLKAYIARDILDNDGFYPIISEIDNTLQKAIKILEKGTADLGPVGSSSKLNAFALLKTVPKKQCIATNKG